MGEAKHIYFTCLKDTYLFYILLVTMGVRKPANAKSGYNFFTSLMHEEFKLLHPGKTVDFIDFQKRCAAKWKGLSATEKRPLEEMAVLDKQRFQEELKLFPVVEGNSKK